MLRRLYTSAMALAASRHASLALGTVSFAESIVFPIPPDALLIPMVLAERRNWFWYAALCTLTSVAGGVVAFLLGALFFEQVALPILQLYGYAEKFNAFAQTYDTWGIWIVAVSSLTPFPFKVVAIAGGAIGINLPLFVLASILSRGLRFFLVAGLFSYAAASIRAFVERRLGLLFSLFVALLVAGLLFVLVAR